MPVIHSDIEALIMCDSLDILIPLMTIGDASQLEVASRTVQAAILLGRAWGPCALRGLQSKFTFVDTEVGCGYRKEDISAVANSLHGVRIIGKVPVQLQSFGIARDLATAVNRAERRAAQHMSRGSAQAQVVVGIFRFVDEGVSQVNNDLLKSCTSKSIRISWGQKETSQLWALRLAWRQRPGDIMLSAVKKRPLEGGVDSLAFDVQAVSNDIVFRMQDVTAKADGEWAKGPGLCLISEDQAKATSTFRDGLLCVMCIYDKSSRVIEQCGKIIHALHLDKIRQTRYI